MLRLFFEIIRKNSCSHAVVSAEQPSLIVVLTQVIECFLFKTKLSFKKKNNFFFII